MEQFLQFNKVNGMYVGNSALPDLDPAFGNTEVLLPGEEYADGIVYVFDESVQMWRTLTLAQFEQHLRKVTPPAFSEEDEFKQFATMKLAELEERIMMLEKNEVKDERSV